jgi:hypothetical protein
MIKSLKKIIIISSVFAMSFIGLASVASLTGLGEIPVEAQNSTKPLPVSRLEEVLKKLRDYLGDLKVYNKEPELSDDQSLIVLKEKYPKMRKYLVLSQEQAIKLYKDPSVLEKLSDSLSLKIKITISCEGSYPPLKIKCTITISW